MSVDLIFKEEIREVKSLQFCCDMPEVNKCFNKQVHNSVNSPSAYSSENVY